MGNESRGNQQFNDGEKPNEVVCEFCGRRLNKYELSEIEPVTTVSDENPLEPETEYYFHKKCEAKFREQFKDDPDSDPITPVK